MKTLKPLERAMQRAGDSPPHLVASSIRGRRLDLALVLDATESMTPYVEEVRQRLSELSAEVNREIPDSRIAVVAYGDYDAPFLTKTQDFTASPQSVATFIGRLGKAPNSDVPEAVEEGLFEANALSWRVGAQRALVLVGDAPPHGIQDSRDKCARGHYYQTEAARLAGQGVRCYAVRCGADPNARLAFSQIATQTSGKYIELDSIGDLVHLLVAICMKEFGLLEQYAQRLNGSGLLTGTKAHAIRQLTGGS